MLRLAFGNTVPPGVAKIFYLCTAGYETIISNVTQLVPVIR